MVRNTCHFGAELLGPNSAVIECPEFSSDGYRTWEQVGGYFDGDGNVGVEVVRHALRFRIRFSDTWEPQIRSIKTFLARNGIASSGVGREKARKGQLDPFRIDVGAVSSVLRAGKLMLPHCLKKAEDLRIAIDYLEGRITGNEAIARFNHEVRAGRRSGFLREPTLPYTRPQGLRIKEQESARKAREAYHVHVSEEIQRTIKSDHERHKLGHARLSKKYGYSVSVIRRILRSP